MDKLSDILLRAVAMEAVSMSLPSSAVWPPATLGAREETSLRAGSMRRWEKEPAAAVGGGGSTAGRGKGY